jgi:rSAM/selenodomain-associated transferase 2
MPEPPLVSIVIPVWLDEPALARTLQRLNAPEPVEVIVASAFDDEPRYQTLRQQHPRVRWTSAPRGRAVQMNAGAALAGGQWILFLHADSELPADWHMRIEEVDRRQDVVAGAFRLALDSATWQARLIEAAVRLRVAVFRLPYGDQALFVRKHVIATIGGYRDLPLMEDVDFVRRVRTVGRVFHSSSTVLTSTRRWEGDGWMRRSVQNVGLATRFLLGASPARLAQKYFGRNAAAVVVMARAPWTAGKTRLDVNTDETTHAELREALFLDTLDAVALLPDVEHIIACEPASECERIREYAPTPVDVIAQRGRDLGERLAHVFEDVFRLGIESVVVVGSDLPDLPPRLIQEAFAALSTAEERVVLGPATDGGTTWLE